MRRRALHVASAIALAGCDDGTKLADFGPTSVDVDAGLFGNVLVDLQSLGGDCPTIDADATATLNGMPMSLVGRGGLDDEPGALEICYPPEFQLPFDPYDISSVTIGRDANATIVIRDAATTWTIEVEGLLTTDIAMIGTPTTNGDITLTWPQAGTSVCTDSITGKNHPCWYPGVEFFDTAGKLVTYWQQDQPGAPQIFTPMGNDWRVALSWATSHESAVNGKPQPGTTQGSLVMLGNNAGGSVSVCDGPSQCHVSAVESAKVYSATLF